MIRYVLLTLAALVMMLGWAPETPVEPLAPAPVASAPAGLFNPAADLTEARLDRLVTLPSHTTPVGLWDGLATQGYPMVETPDGWAFQVDSVTVVDVPGGLYVVSHDGISVCLDYRTNDRECSGPFDARPIS